MNLKTTFLFIGFVVISSFLAQSQDFVYMENGKFYQRCDEFYPVMMNYSLMFEDSAGSYRLTPPMDRCREVKGCNSCGISRQDYRAYIVSHLRAIQAMGFNAVRIVGLALRYDDEKDEEDSFTGNLITNKYYEYGTSGKNRPHCHKQVSKGLPVATRADFKRQGDLFAALFDIIREEKILLKVMLVTGSHGVEVRRKEYGDYLRYLAERFSEEPVLFAYDLYNEPVYQEKIDPNQFSKYDRANWFYSWYKAIKEEAPWHFVTYGPVLTDIYGWDPEVIPTDFFAYHIYATPREHLHWSSDSSFIGYKVNLKYISENFSRPWILGETGLAAVDRQLFPGHEIHPIVRSEEEQRTFVENSLKYTRWYGSRGYALWLFKDAVWSFEKTNTPLAKEFFMGLVNFRENNNWKPAAYEFSAFDPSAPCTDCTDPEPDHYFNPEFFPYPLADGFVFSSSAEGENPVPFRDALVIALLGKPGTDEFNHSCRTFTDANGKFTIRKQYRDEGIVMKLIRISAPSMSVIYRENWGKGLTFDAPFIIHPLDRARLPVVPEQEEMMILSGGKPVLWDRKRVLQEQALIIKKRARLVITDTLFIKPGGSITIREGGILEIDGAAIAGLCEWEGVNVYASESKTRRRKAIGGQVIMKNGGSVMNSRFGIRNFTSD